MHPKDEERWRKARAVRDALLERVSQNPDFEMIDIGSDPLKKAPAPVVRVHIKSGTQTTIGLPREIQGIPIRVLRSNIHLE